MLMSIYPTTLLARIPIVIYSLQICIIACLFLYSYQNFDGTWTNIGPRNQNSNPPIEEKILMSAIAMLLFIKCIFRIEEFYEHRDGTLAVVNEKIEQLHKLPVECVSCSVSLDTHDSTPARIWSSWLGPLRWLDYASKLLINSAIIVLNLWVVFIADSTIDMVINSLALQFIADLEHKCKERLCNMHHRKLMISFNEKVQQKPRAAVQVAPQQPGATGGGRQLVHTDAAGEHPPFHCLHMVRGPDPNHHVCLHLLRPGLQNRIASPSPTPTCKGDGIAVIVAGTDFMHREPAGREERSALAKPCRAAERAGRSASGAAARLVSARRAESFLDKTRGLIRTHARLPTRRCHWSRCARRGASGGCTHTYTHTHTNTHTHTHTHTHKHTRLGIGVARMRLGIPARI